eukprot:1890404-Prorocentrum_lima.AAC.1
MDMLAEDLRFYDACRAKSVQTTTGHCNCGLAFPAKMWKRATGWEFYCSVHWSVLEREVSKTRTQITLSHCGTAT